MFWSAAKKQLFAVEANDIPLLTEIEEKSTAGRKVYLVELKSIPDGNNGDPVTIRGFYCEPTDGNRHPVLIHYQGYDSFTGAAPELESPSGDDRPDYCEFILSTRGQGINNREPYISDGGNPYGQNGWFSANFGNFDSYYYRGAYIDAVRAVDFMATRESSDMHNLFAEGASQGGAFTYVAAALSEYKFTAIAPSITFMSDFPDYLELAGWPTNEARARQKELGWSDDELLLFLSYFDTKNFASNISCPVITSVGVQDYICPPHTVMAPFNLLKTGMADKKVVLNAELQHSVNAKWTSDYLDFFDNLSQN